MGEIDDQLEKIINNAKRPAGHERSANIYTFHQYGKGGIVTIELTGEKIGDIAIEPDQIIEGRLVDQRQAMLLVAEASHQPDLRGRKIVLGMHQTYFKGKATTHNHRNCVAPGGTFAYYFPEDAVEASPFYIPDPDSWCNVAAQYGRIAINGETVFDVIDGQMSA